MLEELDALEVEPLDVVDPDVVIDEPVVVMLAPLDDLLDVVDDELVVPPAPPVLPPSSQATVVRAERTTKDPRRSELQRMPRLYTEPRRAERAEARARP